MQRRIGRRSIVTAITMSMLLVPTMLATAMRSAASTTLGAPFIDSMGRRIFSIYQGARPNPRFAKQLYLTAKADVERSGAPKIQALVLRETHADLPCKPPQAAQGSRTQKPRLLEVQDSCNGHYMYAEWRSYTQSCGGGGYNWFTSWFAADYCDGYYYPPGVACGGCALYEGWCLNCGPR
jgi:hypothetical protein